MSRPGGAGHALLFRDHGVVLENFKDIGPDALTFEAWISTSDYCHSSALLSYAVQPRSRDAKAETVAANHFVVFDPSQLIGCHDFQYMDLWPDYDSESCMSKFNDGEAPPGEGARLFCHRGRCCCCCCCRGRCPDVPA